MKLAIVQSNLTLKGGAERILLKIAQRYRAPIYTAEYDRDKTFEEFGKLDIRIITKGRVSNILPYGRASQGMAYGLSFYNLKLGDEFDVVNAHMAPSHWARNRNERLLWYCHTPLRDVYDLYHYRMSMRKWYTKPVYIAGVAAVRSIDQGVTKRIRYILTNSSNTKGRIKKYYNRKDAHVLSGGIDYQKYSSKGDGKYFIYTSRISPNKRQDFAIEAFRIFSRRMKGYRLVIAGAVSADKFYHDYYKRILAMGKSVGNVQLVENPSEKRLIDLYSRCTAVLYPPINEDYGLVPLEGMASRKPVIAVNDGGPRETVENGKTGLLIDDTHSMAAAMERIAKDGQLASDIGRAGRKRVEKLYSWDTFFKGFDKYARLAAKE